MTTQEEIKEYISRIQRSFSSKEFQHFISYIRFPNFKNLAQDTRIDFEFPFTVFTGLNGSGKSSALHALYGSPFGKSTSEFWFSTNVDPIVDSKIDPNCFIYGYGDPVLVEVLKKRTGQSKGQDYWEPQRPSKKYKMIGAGNKSRTPPIVKPVVYIDFREQLSAFDKYFYFGKLSSTKTIKSKQDYLRRYSKYLGNNIHGGTPSTFSHRKVIKKIVFSSEELGFISGILGKSYSECQLITHNFYSAVGDTAYFKTGNINYSEAYAGRGEFAVVKLVHEILSASNYSLIILDEPEVSLHPGAQEMLKLFLLKQTLKKKLQVIISTHSPKIVELLPDKAIKLFYENSSSRISINNSCSQFEAFQNIGLSISERDKNMIIVEDKTAEMLLRALLKDLGSDYELLFVPKYFPGGAEQIYKKAVVYSEEDEKHKFVLLDGDKRKVISNPDHFTVEQSKDITFLELKLLESTSVSFRNLNFRIDGGAQGGNLEQKISSSIKFLNFLKSNLNYLPKNSPEEILWDLEFATQILKAHIKEVPTFGLNYKENLKNFTMAQFGEVNQSTMYSSTMQFVGNFIRLKNADYVFLKSVFDQFKLKIS